jgi:hypothetical protein
MRFYPGIMVSRKWEDIPFLESGIENVVIVEGRGFYIPDRFKVCGKDVLFHYCPDGMPRTMRKDRKDGKSFYDPD